MSYYPSTITTKGAEMGKTVKAKFSKGVIEPTEKIDIAEGREVMITIMKVPVKTKEDAFERPAGAWKGTIDAKKLIKDIYKNRLLSIRNKPSL